VVSADQHFAQIYGAAFGRNRPQYVGQIFVAECRRLLQIAKLRFDRNGSALTVDLGYAIRRRHQSGAREIQFRRSAAVLVVHCLHAAADDNYAERWGRIRILDCDRGLRIALSYCRQTQRDCDS